MLSLLSTSTDCIVPDADHPLVVPQVFVVSALQTVYHERRLWIVHLPGVVFDDFDCADGKGSMKTNMQMASSVLHPSPIYPRSPGGRTSLFPSGAEMVGKPVWQEQTVSEFAERLLLEGLFGAVEAGACGMAEGDIQTVRMRVFVSLMKRIRMIVAYFLASLTLDEPWGWTFD